MTERYTIVCKECGGEGTVPFKPAKGSEGNLLCKDCYEAAR